MTSENCVKQFWLAMSFWGHDRSLHDTSSTSNLISAISKIKISMILHISITMESYQLSATRLILVCIYHSNRSELEYNHMPTVSSSVSVLVKSYVQIVSQQIIPIDVCRKKSVVFSYPSSASPNQILTSPYPEKTPMHPLILIRIEQCYNFFFLLAEVVMAPNPWYHKLLTMICSLDN